VNPRVMIRGARLALRVSGDGEPMLLCHGGPGVPDYLDSLASMLPGRVFRFEQRGCGASEDTELNDIAALLHDMEALREHWDVESWVVAGHSWGAALALLYALDHPERVSRLLYLNGMGIEMGWEEEHAAEVRRRLSPEERERIESLRAERDTAMDVADRNRLAGELFQRIIALDSTDSRLPSFGERGVNLKVNESLHAEWAALASGGTLADRAAQCTVPTLVLQSADDTRPNWPARNLAERMQDARFVLLDRARHFSWLDRPNEFTAEVAAFLGA